MKELLDALRQLRDEGPRNRREGICWSVNVNLREAGHAPEKRHEALALLQDLCQAWPEFSGSPYSPVPSPFQGRSASEAYDLADERDMWSMLSPYGSARHRLLAFLIAELEG